MNTETFWDQTPNEDTVADEETVEETVEAAPAVEKKTRASKPRTTAKRAPAKPRSAAGKGANRALIVRAVEKTLEVQNLGGDERTLLATVLDVDNNVDDIAVAILLGGAKTDGIAQAIELSEESDDSDRAIAAALLGANTKPVWAVFHGLGLVGAEAPNSVSKTARALSDAASSLASDSSLSDLLNDVMDALK